MIDNQERCAISAFLRTWSVCILLVVLVGEIIWSTRLASTTIIQMPLVRPLIHVVATITSTGPAVVLTRGIINVRKLPLRTLYNTF